MKVETRTEVTAQKGPSRLCLLPAEALLVTGCGSSAEASVSIRVPPPRPSPARYFGEHLKACRRASFERRHLLTHADLCEAEIPADAAFEGLESSSTFASSRESINRWNIKVAPHPKKTPLVFGVSASENLWPPPQAVEQRRKVSGFPRLPRRPR